MKHAIALLKAAVLGLAGLWLIREAVAQTVEIESERFMTSRARSLER